jgi:hypothetical protein
MEEAIQRCAYQLANEMIQKALETFPTPAVQGLVQGSKVKGEEEVEVLEGAVGAMSRSHPSISDDSSATLDESDR